MISKDMTLITFNAHLYFAYTGQIRIIQNGSLPSFLFELSGYYELK